MTKTPALAIVGASLTGAKAAEAARDTGFDGRVVLIGEEAGQPYERPPLSKDILRGDKDTDAARVHPEGFYAERSIELVHDRAVTLDPVARTIGLAGGDRVKFDLAVLATGAAPRRLEVPGASLDNVHYLRTLDDAVRLRDAIHAAERVAVIGAGWIGSEVAASARQMGAEVVLIDPAPGPLHRVLGDEIGAVFGRLHADHGVQLRLGTGVAELRGTKTVAEVVLADGRIEAADVVVVGVGVAPRTDLAAAAGLARDDGIVVDEHLATSVPGIFAAGDVASAFHPHYGKHLRVEHWANALNQGITAGRNAAGKDDTYTRLPYFFSDQYDLGLEYVGHGDGGDAVTVRGDLDAREFIAFWHRDGLVTRSDERERLGRRRRPQGDHRSSHPARRRTSRRSRRPPPGPAVMTKLQRLHEEQGQSPWLDNLTRDHLRSGHLATLVARGVRGVTANPTILAKAIAGSDAYDDQFARLIIDGATVEDAYQEIVISDVGEALHLLEPLYEASNGADGFVSLEVAPALAHDTEASTAEAIELHQRIDRPNLLVKIPATTAGTEAIRQATAAGYSINVTLIFSLDRYAQVIDAYFDGLETFASTGGDLSTVHSVASFFVSRVDSEVARRLPEATRGDLAGRVAVAQARRAYTMFRDAFHGARWDALVMRGATLQRPLWASTSTKDPILPDTLYVDQLIAPDTVTTLPEATIEAFEDHGVVARTIDAHADDAAAVLDRVADLGVDLDDVGATLEEQGVAAFAQSYAEVLERLHAKVPSAPDPAA